VKTATKKNNEKWEQAQTLHHQLDFLDEGLFRQGIHTTQAPVAGPGSTESQPERRAAHLRQHHDHTVAALRLSQIHCAATVLLFSTLPLLTVLLGSSSSTCTSSSAIGQCSTPLGMITN
jgi:hypothetical protein